MAATITLPRDDSYNLPSDEQDAALDMGELRGAGFITGKASWYCDDCGKLNKHSHYQTDCGYVRCQKCGSRWTYYYQLKRAPLDVHHSIVLMRLRVWIRAIARQPAE